MDREQLRRARDEARAGFYRFLNESWGRLPEPAELERYLRLRRVFDVAQRRLDRCSAPGDESEGVRREARPDVGLSWGDAAAGSATPRRTGPLAG